MAGRIFNEHDNKGYNFRFKNPLAQQILRACCRLETAANLIEHKTDAPSTLFFSISKAFEELNDAVKKYYIDFPDFGIWELLRKNK